MTTERQQMPAAVARGRGASSRKRKLWDERLRLLLAGAGNAPVELPAISELLAAAISLASGRRRKALLPLGSVPTEFALVRRGQRVLVDYYGTDTVPEVLLRKREIDLGQLLELGAHAGRALAEEELDPAAARALLRLIARAEQIRLRADPHRHLNPVRVAGGAVVDPGKRVPLAFGFDVSIFPSVDAPHDSHFFADVHALLFEGELWAYCHGRRLSLQRGSVLLAAQRMVAAARALIDAWQAGKPLNVRLRSEKLLIGVMLDSRGEAAVSLGREGQQMRTVTGLDVPGAALPILRLASELLRAFISADRVQSRNLRVSSLRKEVRSLRRLIRSRNPIDGFENSDPELMRLFCTESAADAEPQPALGRARPGRLRFSERWRIELDGLDASCTFLCGDRLIAATAKMTLALDRDSGTVLWSRTGARSACFVTGTVLLKLSASGELELCELDSGRVFARTRLSPRTGAQPFALFAGGGTLPPLAVLPEGRRRLVAIDLRTGEPRWRFHSRGPGRFHVVRWGRVLLVTCGDGSVQALETASGETIWRFADRARFSLPPAVCDDRVVAASGEPAAGNAVLYGIDLYSGHPCWKRDLGGAVHAAPIGAGSTVVVPVGGPRPRELSAFDARDGGPRWKAEDAGIGSGGAPLCLDDSMIVNSPSGRLSALDLRSGAVRWACDLSDSLTDDIPRQLEPVLRHGALFVPAARVHVIRPADGESISSSTQCDLVPDYLRVDERGWLYVAEESGHLRAYAPALFLVTQHSR